MKISFDWGGAYLETKPFFDAMAIAMKKEGHQVGIITGERESRRQEIINSLGFEADFVHLWGEYESIANGYLWKCKMLDQEDVYVHFDDDATEMKKYTPRWILKALNSGEPKKF